MQLSLDLTIETAICEEIAPIVDRIAAAIEWHGDLPKQEILDRITEIFKAAFKN